MSDFRSPIPGRPLPRPLQCAEDSCRERRFQADQGRPPGGGYFQCPGRTGDKQVCDITAFCYPRYKREPAALQRYLQERRLSDLPEELRFHFHEGIDLGKMDDVIVSVVRGKVVRVVNEYTRGFSGYGKCVIVQAGKNDYGDLGGLYFFHAHCKEILVSEGAEVDEQTEIAIAGNTDYTSSNQTSTFEEKRAHLHFEVSGSLRGKAAMYERPPECGAFASDRGEISKPEKRPGLPRPIFPD